MATRGEVLTLSSLHRFGGLFYFVWLFLCKVLCKSIRVRERKTFYQSSGNTPLFTLLKSKNVISKQWRITFHDSDSWLCQCKLHGKVKLYKFRIHLNEKKKSNVWKHVYPFRLFIQLLKATFTNKNILRWKNKIPTKYEKTRSSSKMFRIRTQLVIFSYHLQHRYGCVISASYDTFSICNLNL